MSTSGPAVIRAGRSTPAPWHLYLIECRGGVLYAGITNDLEARYRAHETGQGAKFTRANPPVRLVASRPYPDRAAASRAEWQVKQLPRHKKVAFVLGAECQPVAPVEPVVFEAAVRAKPPRAR